MNWDAIGAVGEIGGAIAVLATLYYLAAQIKMQTIQLEKSNEQARVEISLDVNKSYMEFFDLLLRDENLVRLYHKGIRDEPLDEVEEERFSQYINKFVAFVESGVIANNAGLHFDGDYELNFLVGNPYLHMLLNTRIGSKWFEEKAKVLYSEEFLDTIAKFRN